MNEKSRAQALGAPVALGLKRETNSVLRVPESAQGNSPILRNLHVDEGNRPAFRNI